MNSIRNDSSGGIGQVVEGEGLPYLTGEELRILDAKWQH